MLVLASFAALGIAWLVMLGFAPEPGYFGWNLGSDGTTLIYVTKDSPVWNAGIRVGDRIDWSTLSLLGRANLGLNQAVSMPSRLRIDLSHGTQKRSVELAPTPWPPAVVWPTHLSTIAGVVLLAIGIALVYLKPSRMTWGFLLSSVGANQGPQAAWIYAGQNGATQFLIFDGLAAILSGLAATGILMFTSRFPSDTARGPLVWIDRLAVPAGVLIGLLQLYIVADIVFATSAPPSWVVDFNRYLSNVLVIVLSLVALIVAYALTSGSDRQRVVPVLLAYAFFVASVLGGVIGLTLATDYRKAMGIAGADALATLLLAYAVAVGVVRHRVVDVSFVISRTVVYTILTSILVGTFALIDFLSSQVLEHLQLAVFLEVVAALAFGIGLNSLHARVDRLVDVVLFRRRHLAEQRLRRTGRTLSHAGSESFIDEALVIEASDALDLASAALFRAKDNDFVRVFDAGWDEADTAVLSRDDRLVVNLRSELQPVKVADVRWPGVTLPSGLRHPIVAIPLTARHELLGVVLYGGHNGGELIDPDEQQVLVRLADAATAAYELVHAQALESEAASLRDQNAQLAYESAILREAIDALRTVRPAER